MLTIDPISLPQLSFSKKAGTLSQKFQMPGNRIGWLNTKADQPGAKFDFVIKDGLGRVRYSRENFGSETTEYGELVNLETTIGEDLEVEITDIRGADAVEISIN